MDIKTTKNETPKSKKPIIILSVIAIIVLILAFGGVKPNNITAFNLESDLSEALQVPNSKDIVISYTPANADDIDSIACYVTNADIADLKVKSTSDDKITYELIPKAKGKTTITCTASEYETTFDFEVSTSELEAKEAAEKKAEEERLAAEKAEQERLAAEQKAAEEKAAQEQAAAEQAAQEQAAQEQQQEQMVYITPSGERYHLDASCGGKNSYQVPISQIGSRTPCKKCAGG